MPIRSYAGAAKRTTLSGDITATSTNILVADATGYPTGVDGPFAVAFALGNAAEEKVLIASRSGNTLTVATGGRGYDGTSAADHRTGTSVDHVLTAIDVREANTFVNHGGTLTASAAGVIPLVVKGAASQTANLFRVEDDSGSFALAVNHLMSTFFDGGLTVHSAAQAVTQTSLCFAAVEDPAVRGLVVRGAASQTANLIEAQLSDGTLRTFIDAGGGVRVANGAQGFDGNAWLQIAPVSAANKGLVVRGAASQSANLAEFQNSAGTVLLAVSPNGMLHLASNTAATAVGTTYGRLAVDIPGVGTKYIPLHNA